MITISHGATSIDQDSAFDFYSDTTSESNPNIIKNFIAVEVSGDEEEYEQDESDENNEDDDDEIGKQQILQIGQNSAHSNSLQIEKTSISKQPVKLRNISNITMSTANNTSIMSSNSFMDSSYNTSFANTTQASLQNNKENININVVSRTSSSKRNSMHGKTSSIQRQSSTNSASTGSSSNNNNNNTNINKKRWSALSFMSDHSNSSKKRYPSGVSNNITTASITPSNINNTPTTSTNISTHSGSSITNGSSHHYRTTSNVSSVEGQTRNKRFSTSSLQSLKSATSLKNLFSSSNSQTSVEETHGDIMMSMESNTKRESAALLGLQILTLDETHKRKTSNTDLNNSTEKYGSISKHDNFNTPSSKNGHSSNNSYIKENEIQQDDDKNISTKRKKSYSQLSKRTSNVSLHSSPFSSAGSESPLLRNTNQTKTLSHSRSSYVVPQFQKELNSQRKLKQSPSLTSLTSITSGKSWKFWKRKSTINLYESANNISTVNTQNTNINVQNINEKNTLNKKNSNSQLQKVNSHKTAEGNLLNDHNSNHYSVPPNLQPGNTSIKSNHSVHSSFANTAMNNDTSSVTSSTKHKKSFSDLRKSLFSDSNSSHNDDTISVGSSGNGSIKTRSSMSSLRKRASSISLRQKTSQTSLKKTAAPNGNTAISLPIPDQASRDKIRMKLVHLNDNSNEELPLVNRNKNSSTPENYASSGETTQSVTNQEKPVETAESLSHSQLLRKNVVPDYDHMNYKRLSKSISLSNIQENITVSDYYELFEQVDEVSRTLPPHILKNSEILYERGNTRVLLDKLSNKTYKLIAFDSTDHIFIPLLVKHLKFSKKLSQSEWACPILKSWLISTNIPQRDKSSRYSYMANANGHSMNLPNSASCLLILEMENRGRPLSEVLTDKPNVAPRTLSRIFSKLITILADWETNYQFEHRDLSLDNILIDINNKVTVIDYKLGKGFMKTSSAGKDPLKTSLSTRLDHPLFYVRSLHYEVYSELRQIEPYIDERAIGWAHIIWLKYILHSMIKSCKIKDKHFDAMKEWLHFIIKHQGEIMSCKELSRYRKGK